MPAELLQTDPVPPRTMEHGAVALSAPRKCHLIRYTEPITMTFRRPTLFLVLPFLFWPIVRADADEPGFVEITPRTRVAIDKGLEYLSKTQNDNGSWTDMIGRKVNDRYIGHMGDHVGVTALVCIAFMSNGSLPGRGKYGKEVEKGLQFVLDCVHDGDGFIAINDSRMYSHAFAALFLGEVYGMTRDRRIRHKLQKAIDLIVRGQNDQGGWRYLPGAKDSDISITVCQVQALRAARNGGIFVPKDSIDRAVKYVRSSFISSHPWPAYRGGFWYQVFENPLRPSRTTFALTAAGVTALYGAGVYDTRETREGLRFLYNHRPNARDMRQTFDYFYGHYYAVQAFYQAGGKYWENWYPFIRDQILTGQRGDGSWRDLVGPNYATATATIILQVPYRYLPIFER